MVWNKAAAADRMRAVGSNKYPVLYEAAAGRELLRKSREDLLRLMEIAWGYVTPLSNGIPSTALFREKLEYYAAGENENFRFFILDISMEVPQRPVLYEVIGFIQNGLHADFPIDMYLKGQQFYSRDGVVSAGVEKTIQNIGRLGKDVMCETDKEILCIMTCVD